MAIAPITSASGTGVHVPGADIDTDRIIPARFMKCVTFDGLGEYLFNDVRREEDGTPKDHPIDDPRFAGASVLLTGPNFGCGSSREHAPQALYRHGFRAVIAESFAEIFFGNCTTLGIPCAVASAEDIAALAALIEADPSLEITIDVEAREMRAGDQAWPVAIPDSAREAFLSAEWDPMGVLLTGADEVEQASARLSYMGQ